MFLIKIDLRVENKATVTTFLRGYTDHTVSYTSENLLVTSPGTGVVTYLKSGEYILGQFPTSSTIVFHKKQE